MTDLDDLEGGSKAMRRAHTALEILEVRVRQLVAERDQLRAELDNLRQRPLPVVAPNPEPAGSLFPLSPTNDLAHRHEVLKLEIATAITDLDMLILEARHG